MMRAELVKQNKEKIKDIYMTNQTTIKNNLDTMG